MVDLILIVGKSAGATGRLTKLDESAIWHLRGSHDSVRPHRVSSGFNKDIDRRGQHIRTPTQQEISIRTGDLFTCNHWSRCLSKKLTFVSFVRIVTICGMRPFPFPSVSPTPTTPVTEGPLFSQQTYLKRSGIDPLAML